MGRARFSRDGERWAHDTGEMNPLFPAAVAGFPDVDCRSIEAVRVYIYLFARHSIRLRLRSHNFHRNAITGY